MQPKTGDVIDGFRLGERMHLGGMAVIHRVEGPRGPLPLVMKIPRLGAGQPASNVIGFEMERTVLGLLSGPHVPSLVCCGDVEGCPYLVMELIDGSTLEEATARAPLPPAEVARLGAAMATALHDVHRQGVVHLDLKPANVMFRPDGRAVLVDFGLSHHRRQPDLMAEEFRTPMGNWPYMAPEQVVGVRHDWRSDLFALGAMLYELATGELPFGLPETQAGLQRRLHTRAAPLRALKPEVPDWLQEVVLRCLESSAADRPLSASQVAFELTHHDQIVVGERGQRLKGDGLWRQLRQQWRSAKYLPSPVPDDLGAAAVAPIVVVAVPTDHTNDALFDALRQALQRVLAGQPACRVACVAVVPPSSASATADSDQTPVGQHIRHLVLLRQWARPLGLAEGAVTFHVLESSRPAQALVDYAQANMVDQIILGASARGGRRSGVAAQVAADAPCHVLLVRLRASEESPVR
jgi:eukaryotic-like serine/threonine-protein kinase